jgi:hypothetical protein
LAKDTSTGREKMTQTSERKMYEDSSEKDDPK